MLKPSLLASLVKCETRNIQFLVLLTNIRQLNKILYMYLKQRVQGQQIWNYLSDALKQFHA